MLNLLMSIKSRSWLVEACREKGDCSENETSRQTAQTTSATTMLGERDNYGGFKNNFPSLWCWNLCWWPNNYEALLQKKLSPLTRPILFSVNDVDCFIAKWLNIFSKPRSSFNQWQNNNNSRKRLGTLWKYIEWIMLHNEHLSWRFECNSI